MRILVSAASKHGSTAEVATHIAETLDANLPGDVVVDVIPAGDVGETTSYDAVILGSAVYLGRWLEDARKLAQRIAANPPRPVFPGRLDRNRLGLGEKAVVMALRVPDGDFRDYAEIDTWGTQIPAELSRAGIGKP